MFMYSLCPDRANWRSQDLVLALVRGELPARHCLLHGGRFLGGLRSEEPAVAGERVVDIKPPSLSGPMGGVVVLKKAVGEAVTLTCGPCAGQ
jgi:hypothetical protein